MHTEYKIIAFIDQPAFREWLGKNGNTTQGIWMRIYKKASAEISITYREALDEALCYGWIDGQRRSYDELSYLQKFTPRRSKSIWSKRNVEHIARLREAGFMTPAGMLEVSKAQADGRWQAAYDAASEMEVPQDFLSELSRWPKAEAFFNSLNKTNRFAIAWRLQTAKTPVTRTRRMERIISMLDAGEKLQ